MDRQLLVALLDAAASKDRRSWPSWSARATIRRSLYDADLDTVRALTHFNLWRPLISELARAELWRRETLTPVHVPEGQWGNTARG